MGVTRCGCVQGDLAQKEAEVASLKAEVESEQRDAQKLFEDLTAARAMLERERVSD